MNPYRPFPVTLARRATVSPSFVRITLAGSDLGTCSPTLLDQRVKLVIGEPDALATLAAEEDWYGAWLATPDAVRPAVRTYTLLAVRPARDGSGEVDIDIATHDLGGGAAPGLRFALDAPVGAPSLLIAGDRTRPGHDTVGLVWRPNGAREVLLVGDETALPAVVNIAGSLPPDTTGRIVLEVPHPADVRAFPAPDAVHVDWRVRSAGERAVGIFGRPAGEVADDGVLLWDEAEAPDGRQGWVAGEACWVRSLRAEARVAGVPRGQVAFMGYWKRGEAAS